MNIYVCANEGTNTILHTKKRLSISLRRFVKGKAINLDNTHTNPVIRYLTLCRTDFRE